MPKSNRMPAASPQEAAASSQHGIFTPVGGFPEARKGGKKSKKHQPEMSPVQEEAWEEEEWSEWEEPAEEAQDTRRNLGFVQGDTEERPTNKAGWVAATAPESMARFGLPDKQGSFPTSARHQHIWKLCNSQQRQDLISQYEQVQKEAIRAIKQADGGDNWDLPKHREPKRPNVEEKFVDESAQAGSSRDAATGQKKVRKTAKDFRVGPGRKGKPKSNSAFLRMKRERLYTSKKYEGTFFPKSAWAEISRLCCNKYRAPDARRNQQPVRWTRKALWASQYITEQIISDLLSEANRAAKHAKRVTVGYYDLDFIKTVILNFNRRAVWDHVGKSHVRSADNPGTSRDVVDGPLHE